MTTLTSEDGKENGLNTFPKAKLWLARRCGLHSTADSLNVIIFITFSTLQNLDDDEYEAYRTKQLARKKPHRSCGK